MNVYKDISVASHERVVYCENIDVGLKAFIAVHNTQRGPSLGGCRMWDYDTEADALCDVLRLSRGMTFKNALADLDIGGGKSVIWGNSKTQKTPLLLKAMGEFVQYMNGRYIIAEDVGMTVKDILVIREITKFTPDPTAGDPGPTTAKGVYIGIKEACKFLYGTDILSGIQVAVQGAGSVGLALIEHLRKENAEVYVADISQRNLQKAIALGSIPTSVDSIHSVDCHVFAPCALGAIINDTTIPQLNCDIVAGSANNQLLESSHGADLLKAGILYAPDYVINAGGVIMIAGETANGFDHSIVDRKVNNIGPTLACIFEASRNTGTPTNIIAREMANKMLQG